MRAGLLDKGLRAHPAAVPAPHGRGAPVRAIAPNRSAVYRSSLRPAGQFTAKPGFGESPITMDSVGGDVQHFGGFLHAQAAEEPQLHHPALPLVERFQGVQARRRARTNPERRLRAPPALSRRSRESLRRPVSRSGATAQNPPGSGASTGRRWQRNARGPASGRGCNPPALDKPRSPVRWSGTRRRAVPAAYSDGPIGGA